MKASRSWKTIAGWVLHGLVGGIMLLAGSAKVLGLFPPEQVAKLGLGVPIQVIGAGELVSAVLLLVPRTASLGVLLTSGFWGGVPGEGRTSGQDRPGPAPSRGPRNHREPKRGPAPFGIKILCAHRGDVPDFVTGVEQGAYLPVIDARVSGMMNDRAHDHPHRALPPGQRASTCGAAGVFGTTPRVSSRSRAVRAIRARS